MHRLLLLTFATLLLTACGTSPMGTEAAREVVLQYLGTDVGTAGPFYKGGKQELGVLSASDREKASTLIDEGAALFLIYPGHAAARDANAGHPTRVVLIHRGTVVGDFPAVPAAAAAH